MKRVSVRTILVFFKKRWKFVVGMVLALAGLDLATKGEYKAGWDDCCGTADNIAKKYGPECDLDQLSKEDWEEAYNQNYK